MARRTIESLIALTIPEIQNMFLEVMQDIVDRAVLNEMIEAIEANDADRLFKATGFTPAALGPLLDRIEQAYFEAAEVTGDGFPNRIKTPTGTMIFRFNARNTAVEEDLRTYSSQMISRLTEEMRENVRVTLERGMIAGQNPRATALDIVGRVDSKTKQRVGGVIGLTTHQERWVANTRRYLEQVDARYFNLELRDKRFDATVRKALDNGEQLPAATIDRLVTAYKSRALKYRAEAVARTETIQSINRGEFRAHMQAVEEGALERSAIKRMWDAVGDRKTRHTHAALDEITRKKPIGLDEPFISPSGARMMFPGDSSLGAGPEEIVHCRCRVKYNVDWFAGVD